MQTNIFSTLNYSWLLRYTADIFLNLKRKLFENFSYVANMEFELFCILVYIQHFLCICTRHSYQGISNNTMLPIKDETPEKIVKNFFSCKISCTYEHFMRTFKSFTIYQLNYWQEYKLNLYLFIFKDFFKHHSLWITLFVNRLKWNQQNQCESC